MKKRIIIIGAAAVFAVGLCLYTVGNGGNRHHVFAEILSTESSESEISEESSEAVESSVIVIPEDSERYGSISVTNALGDAVTAKNSDGEAFTISGASELDYSESYIFDELADDVDLSVSGKDFNYEIAGNSIESVTVNPGSGLSLLGDDYTYTLSFALTSTDEKISFSGKSSRELSVDADRISNLTVSSKTAIGDIDVASSGESHHYQINATSCVINSDGSVTLKDGSIAAATDESNESSAEGVHAENVFHTIEPALFVRGGSTAVANAAKYINDYVYDNEETASALIDDGEVREYYEYYGESGSLSFTITILGSGNHARISTSDGEIHDYICEPQEGAHCYPVFSL